MKFFDDLVGELNSFVKKAEDGVKNRSFMPTCKLCGKSGLLLKINPIGMCDECFLRVRSECTPVIEKMNRSLETFDDYDKEDVKYGCANKIVELSTILLNYEYRGIILTSPAPSVLIKQYSDYIDKYRESHMSDSKVKLSTKKSIREILSSGYAVLDFETTGLDSSKDKIIEVGIALVDNGAIVNEYSTYVNPLMRIPDKATEINHITDDMVCGAPTIDVVLPQIFNFISGRTVIGHNCEFDVKFLKVANGNKLPDDFKFSDTIDIAKKAYPDFKNYKLQTLVKNLDLPKQKAHAALGDVRSTVALFEKCAAKLIG